VPCLVRRSAIESSGRLDPTAYTWDDLRSPLSTARSADLRAVKLALERYNDRAPALADVLRAGPLPGNDEHRRGYLDVFGRGLAELRQFVDRHA
jgi:hypothetical protein